MGVVEYLREFRQWIIIIVLVIFVAGIVWQIRSCEMNDIINQKNELEKKADELKQKVDELEKQLESRPVVVKTETKYQKIKVCIDVNTKKEVDCNSAGSVEVDITKEKCCELVFTTEFSNDYIICRDKDVCKKGDESIELTEKGKQVFRDIKTDITDLSKRGIFKISLLGGYDVVPSYFIVGVQFIDWYNFGFGVDIGSDFKHFTDSRGGVFGSYRLSFFKTATNIGLGLGLSTPVKNLGKEYMLQVMILFYIIDF